MNIRNIVCVAITMGVGCVTAAPLEFYVSPTGADKNLGTKEAPFRTLEKAKMAVRRVNKTMTDDIHVFLHGGDYPLEKALEFTPADSGTNGYRVIYRATEGEVPVLNGGETVTRWKQVEGNMFKARLNRSTKLRSLFVNGQRAFMASTTADAQGGWGTYKVRKGQDDWAWVDGSTEDGVRFSGYDVPELENASDVEVMRNTKFNSHIIYIREVATEGSSRILKFQQPHAAIAMPMKPANAPGSRFAGMKPSRS